MPEPIHLALAFATAATLGLVLSVLAGRSSHPWVRKAGEVLGCTAATYAGVWVLGLLPHVPPREDLDRLLVIVLPAACVAELIAAGSAWASWVVRGIVAALAVPVLLDGSVYVTDLSGPDSREWSPERTWVTCAALAVLLLVAWVAMERLAVRTLGLTPLAAVAGAVLGAGLVVMLSGYASGGQLGLPLAAGLGGVALCSLVRKRASVGRYATGVGVVGLFSLLLVGKLFAGLSTFNAVLLFAAPLLGWLPEFLSAGALRLTLAAGPVVVALALAGQKFAADSARPESPESRPESGTAGSVDDYLNFGK